MAITDLYLLLLLLPLTFFIFLTLILRPRPVKIPIKGSHVFITGGSSGIGLALAHQAASQGAARVSILSPDLAQLIEARNTIRNSTGIEVAIFNADVRDMEEVRRAIEEAGPIDVLICNQGVYFSGEFDSQELESMKLMVDVNLMGTINVIKVALPGMKNRRDRSRPASIALMSSQLGQLGIYGYAAYSATKFGLRGLGEALQEELIADNIHISIIFPPSTDTPGLVQDMKRRPGPTKFIASTSGTMKADEIAKISLNGIQSGTFTITCNLKGLVMSIANAGFCPQRSPLMAFIEVVTAGIMRFIALIYLWIWYRTIASWNERKKSVEKNNKNKAI